MNQKTKDLLLLLSLQILTVPLVILIFKTIEPLKLAAVCAACVFILTGFLMIFITRKWEEYRAHFCYWLIRVQVFIIAIPMLLGRLIFWEKDFTEIYYFGFSGPEFHKFSEQFYVFLFAATVLDFIIHLWKTRKIKS